MARPITFVDASGAEIGSMLADQASEYLVGLPLKALELGGWWKWAPAIRSYEEARSKGLAVWHVLPPRRGGAAR